MPRRPPILVIIRLLIGCLLSVVAERCIADAVRPNIIHIMIDDAGLGDFTCYWEQSPVATPHIDRLAAEGMRFTQAYAGAANCAPSRSALMTGRHLGRAFLRCNAGSISIRDKDVTLAEVLQRAGYATGGYGKWGLGPPGSPGAPELQGFDEFVGYYDQVHAHSHFPDRIYDSGKALLIPENAEFQEPETGLVDDRRIPAHQIIFERTCKFIRTNASSGRPFYVWGAWTPPHRKSTMRRAAAAPGQPYARYAEVAEWDDFSKIQAGLVSWVDDQIALLRDTLEDPNDDGDTADSILNDTLILFTSDNGGWQSRHAWDRNIETRHGRTVDIRGAKEGYYEGGLRTPMIAFWPGVVPAGSTSDLPVAFYDYLPTFAELAGVDAPLGLDGVSFAPTLTGRGPQAQREGLYFEGYAYRPNSRPTQVARIADWKMIRSPDGATELFDLASDPSETTNRFADPAAKTVRTGLDEFMERNHTPMTAHFSVVPPDVGSGNARRDGAMAWGIRPGSVLRDWKAAGGDVVWLRSGVETGDDQELRVFLDDFHQSYSVDCQFERSDGSTPRVAVDLLGQSGFAYFSGHASTDGLAVGRPQHVQIRLAVSQKSPTQEQLANDLGAGLWLRFTHEGAVGQIRVSEIVVSNEAAN
ncbi:MAG: sulfatase-like hydrolase/transferase [Planctomycetales bacterium]|nr:sulfatase-like hydrolase/transferase [Planctomycetales bacterium]